MRRAALKSILLLTSLCMAGWTQSAPKDIRGVDFKNFSYPWVPPTSWPDHLQWMSLRLEPHIQLVGGKWDERKADDDDETNAPFEGLTLEGVDYARLSSDQVDDAIVVLRHDSGGTQYHYWVYIYGGANGTAKLLGFFHSGDRAAYGLYRVFVKNRILTVQLFDPKFGEGDCCSSGSLTYGFRWNGKGFEAIGNPIPGPVETESRRAVSIFGLPIEQH